MLSLCPVPSPLSAPLHSALSPAPAARGRESGGADRVADYREKMLRRGMDTDAFRFREETFRNGMPPHGGFAIGLERITACFLGIANVKECSMFPRDINWVAP